MTTRNLTTCVVPTGSLLLSNGIIAQSNISFQRGHLKLAKPGALRCGQVFEADPNDLDEGYACLVSYVAGGAKSDDQRFELNFPAHVAN